MHTCTIMYDNVRYFIIRSTSARKLFRMASRHAQPWKHLPFRYCKCPASSPWKSLGPSHPQQDSLQSSTPCHPRRASHWGPNPQTCLQDSVWRIKVNFDKLSIISSWENKGIQNAHLLWMAWGMRHAPLLEQTWQKPHRIHIDHGPRSHLQYAALP